MEASQQQTPGHEQRQYPRFGLGLPVTLLFGIQRAKVVGALQDISCGGCFFKAPVTVDLERRIAVVLHASSGKKWRATGRVVRTVAYKGFAVLFDEPGSRAIGDLIKLIEPLAQEARVAFLSTELKPEIEIF
jgi:hypothetical protein